MTVFGKLSLWTQILKSIFCLWANIILMHYPEPPKHLRLDIEVCFYRWLFPDTVNPRWCISWPMWTLRGINKTPWGAKLILTADLAFPVSCASIGHLLMAQPCPLSLNICFSPPTTPHPPPPPISPAHPL